MTQLIKSTLAIALFSTVYSCSSESYLFADKNEQMEIKNHQGALLGYWLLDSAEATGLGIGIENEEGVLKINTPVGERLIESIQPMGELDFVLQLNSGDKSERILAKFKSYQRTTLMLMSSGGLDIGLNADIQVTLRKAKEETVLTASSNN